jgi:hypothetical protein
MPFRHYECANGHITEQLDLPKKAGKTIYTLKEIIESQQAKKERTIKCSNCSKKAVEVYLSRRAVRDARNFAPTLLYIDDKGNVFNPGRNDSQQLPNEIKQHLKNNGYKETNITNYRDYEKFQRQQRILLKDQRDEYINNLQQEYDYTINKEIEALKNGGEIEFPNGDGTTRIVKVPALKDMHPKMRAMAEMAIENAKNHRINRPFRDPLIATMEYEENTRLAQDERSEVRAGKYRDIDTGWISRG